MTDRNDPEDLFGQLAWTARREGRPFPERRTDVCSIEETPQGTTFRLYASPRAMDDPESSQKR